MPRASQYPDYGILSTRLGASHSRRFFFERCKDDAFLIDYLGYTNINDLNRLRFDPNILEIFKRAEEGLPLWSRDAVILLLVNRLHQQHEPTQLEYDAMLRKQYRDAEHMVARYLTDDAYRLISYIRYTVQCILMMSDSDFQNIGTDPSRAVRAGTLLRELLEPAMNRGDRNSLGAMLSEVNLVETIKSGTFSREEHISSKSDKIVQTDEGMLLDVEFEGLEDDIRVLAILINLKHVLRPAVWARRFPNKLDYCELSTVGVGDG